ncbi:nicotinic acetylcholine receptor alpha subunit [Trichuris trichiura]|uniref:Nicotinic acetylcholine receptor alpha subunit n=1 Tax=Trichuris trichiura TaxID=36087 RepID=A0A077Z6Z0_TRITR|nr:nicotinic acetylcholine receptor alpha subunit [Trichuris trichiura]
MSALRLFGLFIYVGAMLLIQEEDIGSDCFFCFAAAAANENAKRLIDDLLMNYNKLRRPVKNPKDVLTVKLKLRLSQIIDLVRLFENSFASTRAPAFLRPATGVQLQHEKDQIMTTSVWLKQEWMDNKLIWDPKQYGGVRVLYVPAEMIWLPDIVLYNNAASNYNISITTKATLHHDGLVRWEPPAIYKSMCFINVEWFPFDEQTCHLKFGSWTYTEEHVDLQHMDPSVEHVMELSEADGSWRNVSIIRNGIDLSDYYPSVEWDILSIPAKRHARAYNSCCSKFKKDFIDITYYINLRRKPLFYTVNLIFPCFGISFLTILVFYLPSDSNEKISLCIAILVSLTVFVLLLTEIIPATSIVLPLIGKYLLFTMIMVTLSVIVTVVSLNLHFRNPATHRMPKWVKQIFLRTLPHYLFMRRPLGDDDDDTFRRVSSRRSDAQFPHVRIGPSGDQANCYDQTSSFQRGRSEMVGRHFSDAATESSDRAVGSVDEIFFAPPVLRAFQNVCFIARLLQKKDKDDKIDEDWKYVAMVFDRLFLWIFSIACFLGTVIILLRAPSLYDDRVPIEPRLPTTPQTLQHVY